MSITVACDQCGKKYRVAETAVGKRAKCKECGNSFMVAAVVMPQPVRSVATPPPLPRKRVATSAHQERRGDESISPAGLKGPVAPNAVASAGTRVYPAILISAAVLLVLAVLAVALMRGAKNKEQPTFARGFQSPQVGGGSPIGKQSTLQLRPVVPTVSYHFPPRPPMKTLPTGEMVLDQQLSGEGPAANTLLYIYLPKGAHASKSLPCIFIAPAGSHCIDGVGLGDGDRREHWPYVDAGFAVIAYSLDGAGPGGRQKYIDMVPNIGPFQAAHGGLDNARMAIAYALTEMPEIDPDRLYTVGHSSAATIALDIAAADPRIKACCSYCPAVDLHERIAPKAVPYLAAKIAGFEDFLNDASPSSHVDALKAKPVLLFTAEDDTNVAPQLVKDFAATLKSAGGANIRLVVASKGGHYQSMIHEGIPAGIRFLSEVDGRMPN